MNTIDIFHGGNYEKETESNQGQALWGETQSRTQSEKRHLGTSIPREKAERINAFLEKYGYTKVQLIEAGYKALLDDAGEHNLSLGKIMDGYDDFFPSELEAMKKTD